MVSATGYAVAAEWPSKAPEEILIKDKVYEGQFKKGPVKFPHKMHFVEKGVACQECHHRFEDGKNVWTPEDPVQKCNECHPYDKSQGKLLHMRMGKVFHERCRDCHKKREKGGPTSCKGCHQDK